MKIENQISLFGNDKGCVKEALASLTRDFKKIWKESTSSPFQEKSEKILKNITLFLEKYNVIAIEKKGVYKGKPHSWVEIDDNENIIIVDTQKRVIEPFAKRFIITEKNEDYK